VCDTRETPGGTAKEEEGGRGREGERARSSALLRPSAPRQRAATGARSTSARHERFREQIPTGRRFVVPRYYAHNFSATSLKAR
jgi:hypothetical protein